MTRSSGGTFRSRRILIGCDELPEYGEGGVAAFRLFETMLEDGLDVTYVNLVDDADALHAQYTLGKPYGNPTGIEGVHNCRVSGSADVTQLQRLLCDLGPAILLGIGERATSYLKRASSAVRVIGYASRMNPDRERNDAIEAADLVIASSAGTLDSLNRDFPQFAGKIHPAPVWCAEWIARRAAAATELLLPFDERQIEVLFLATSSLVRRISGRMRSGVVHVAAETELRSPTERMALYGRARTVVVPFIGHPAPPEVFEAAACGCNLIASRQCGNGSVCHPELLVDRPRVGAILRRIERARQRYAPLGFDDYLARRGYDDLVETLLAF